MSNVWLKRLSGLTAMSLVASLVVLTGCHDCDDDCGKHKKHKHDCCDGGKVSMAEGEWRPVGGTANVDGRAAWQNEEQYWRSNYSTRPYASQSVSYDEYAPAYRYGYDTRRRYQGQRFDDLEKDLARDWDHMRDNSKLTWEQARPAVRDSWDRNEARIDLRAGESGANISVGTRPSWDSDEQYWKSNYSSRPYFSAGTTYDDYSPAYRYGYESRTKYQGKKYEDVEVDMSRGWDTAKGTSKLGWEKAKEATRDAWNRADRAVTGDRR